MSDNEPLIRKTKRKTPSSSNTTPPQSTDSEPLYADHDMASNRAVQDAQDFAQESGEIVKKVSRRKPKPAETSADGSFDSFIESEAPAKPKRTAKPKADASEAMDSTPVRKPRTFADPNPANIEPPLIRRQKSAVPPPAAQPPKVKSALSVPAAPKVRSTTTAAPTSDKPKRASASKPSTAKSGTGTSTRKKTSTPVPVQPKRVTVWALIWVVVRNLRPRTLAGLVVVLVIVVVIGPGFIAGLSARTVPTKGISPIFTAEVQHWAPQIAMWGAAYNVDPNLLATLIQIESCGWSGAESTAGAQGLFQVMPFHFTDQEKQVGMTEPELNAKRGAGVIKDCLERSNGDVGLAMACYNGGPRLIPLPFTSWPAETQRYFTYGTGIYTDANSGKLMSPAVQMWLDAGGVYLCRTAAESLDLPYSTYGDVSEMGILNQLPNAVSSIPEGPLPTYDPLMDD
jgi:hypothetical protein